MLKRSQVFIVIGVIVTAGMLAACISDSADAGDPTTVGQASGPKAATRLPATAIVTEQKAATPSMSPTVPAAITESSATASVPVAAESSSAPATITPSVGYYKKSEIPADSVCTEDTVIAIFEEFFRRYNAEDIEGVLDMMQVNLPDQQYVDAGALDVFNQSGEVEFQFISMSMRWHDDLSFVASTSEELRAALMKRFAVDDRLRLTHVTIAPARVFVERDAYPGAEPGSYISKRNAVVGPQFEEWNTVDDLHEIQGKGAVDCETGKIIRLSAGG